MAQVARPPGFLWHSQQFSGARHFLSWSDAQLPVWTNWEYSRRNLYEPLLTMAKEVYLFGEVNLDARGLIISGPDFLEADRGVDPRTYPGPSEHRSLVERIIEFLKAHFVWSGKAWTLRGSAMPLIGHELFPLAAGHIPFGIRPYLLATFSLAYLPDALLAIRRHSLTDVNGPVHSAGDRQKRTRVAVSAVKSGGFAVAVACGECRVFYPPVAEPAIRDLVKHVNTEHANKLQQTLASPIWSSPDGA
jgi:hypothetical protein